MTFRHYGQKALIASSLLMLCTNSAWASNGVSEAMQPLAVNAIQQRSQTVKVQVVDASGPLIGANVTVKGTTNGAITDFDGNLSLQNVPTNATLVVSYVGYKTQEIALNGKSSLVVTLEEDSETLSEVVVVGYGTLEKKQVTSSITSLKSGDLLTGVGGSDITSSLQGKIAGLSMYNNGSINAGTSIQLRGLTSINAGTSPLIVIDGVPGGDIRSLHQDDIKSIDVLKDASAGAIYGTRAASGVILITTKSGQDTNGKLKVNYSLETNHKQNYRKPNLLTGREYVQHGIGTDYGQDTDWWDVLLNKNNFSQKHHLGIDFGTEKAQFYTSVFYEKQQGIAVNDGRTDYGGRFSATLKLFDGWLEVRPNVEYRQASRDNNAPDFQQAMRNNPTRSPFDKDSESGYRIWTDESLDYNVLADSKLTDYYGVDKWFMPEVTFKLNIKPIPGLSYQQVFGYENRQWENHVFRSKYHRESVANNYKGYGYMGFSKTENKTSEGYFSYVHEFKGGHNLNATAGYSYFEANGDNFSMSNYDFSVDGIGVWDMGNGSYLRDGKAGMSSGKNITERLFSLFGRVNYSYQDRYMASASFRHEGSSKFAVNNRWGNFWAVTAGWRISNEAFMKNVDWVNDLKVRFGYGVTGNNDFGATFTANLLGSDTLWMLPNGSWEKSYGKTQNVNDNLGWEEKKEWNVGIDYSLFDNRLYGKLDVYRRKIDGMIYSVSVPMPPYTQGSQYRNIGSMESKGWEFEIGGDIIRKKDLNWNAKLNLSHNSGKILSLWGDATYINGNGFVAPGTPGDASRIEAGTEIGSFYTWKFAGFDDEGGFLLYNKDGQVIPAKDKTEGDKFYNGSYTPDLMLGFNTSVSYKNFDLGVSMHSWLGFDVFNTLDMYYGIQGKGNFNLLKSAYGEYNHIKGEKQICDYYMQDGSFLKIDAVTLGYTFNLAKATNNMLDRVRVYTTLGNLATITGYKGMNPEQNVNGWDQGTERFWSNFYPVYRTYTLGLQVNF